MSKQIPLTQGQFAIVDDEDYEWLNQWKWRAHKSHRTWYAVRMIRRSGKCIELSMHREILKPPKNVETDHKDGNGLNNQRYNLRWATKTQNRQNQRPQEGCTSRFKGVRWDKNARKWRACIKVQGKQVHLGFYSLEIDAARAYDNAALLYFKEFARTNFS